MEDVFFAAYEYAMILAVPITLLSAVMLADEILVFFKRSVLPYTRSRRR